ncbi:MAG: phosphate signaling complex protein PhoU [Phycisphaerales bacterium]
MPDPKQPQPTKQQIPLRVANDTQLDQQLAALRRRVIREASQAIDLLQQSIEVLWNSTDEGVQEIRDIENEIDAEEVKIEQECFRILALQQPFGADFRLITFSLKVNSDIERLADHASSIAKISKKVRNENPDWPKSLQEMGERIPVMCQELLRAVINTDPEAAREVVARDKIIDRLDKQTFRELTAKIEENPQEAAFYMLMYRISRELERVGDLLGNIAEDIIYLVTGEIVRHEGGPGKARSKPADS